MHTGKMAESQVSGGIRRLKGVGVARAGPKNNSYDRKIDDR